MIATCGARLIVALGEATSGDQRDAHRREIVRRHDDTIDVVALAHVGRRRHSPGPARTSRFRSCCRTAAWVSKRSPLSPRTPSAGEAWRPARIGTCVRRSTRRPRHRRGRTPGSADRSPRRRCADCSNTVRNSPAPTSSTTEIDTCTTRSARDSIVFEAATLRLVSFSALPTSIFVARSAGAMPKMIPVSMVMPDVNARMRQSAGADVPTGAGSSGCPQRASARPAMPPMPASSRLSVSSWRTSRQRVAPIDSRTEISR